MTVRQDRVGMTLRVAAAVDKVADDNHRPHEHEQQRRNGIATCCYRHRWYSFNELKSVFRELAMAAYGDTASTRSRAERLLTGSSWLGSAFLDA
jgi:hypothetical protein